MTAPVAAGDPGTVTVRPMRWWDIEPVLDVEADLFGDEAWTPGLFWSELALLDRAHYVVAVDGDRIVGYAGLATVGDEGYVQTIAVVRDRWGQGLGTGLLVTLMTEAQRRAVTTLVLEVRADNERAQALYERFGFSRVGVRRGYYQPSGMDAVVMVRS